MGEHGGGISGRGAVCMTTNQELVLSVLRAQGTADALDLRSRAADLDGTAIIAEESKAPQWDAEKDYSLWPAGAPVCYDSQVYKLLQPHDASHYPDSDPATSPALWSICHTKDPEHAKPYIAPNGTSGMYMTGECCTVDVTVYRSTIDNNVWPPADYPQGWEVINSIGTEYGMG